MEDMQSWIKVVMEPLGLAGFALFLVFGFLARTGLVKGQRWLAVSAVSMAIVALIGGLGLSWVKSRPTAAPTQNTTSTLAAPTPPAIQTTHGAQSPAVQNVQGSVIINMDQEGRKK